MSKKPSNQPEAETISASDVRSYLLENEGFFLDHGDVLEHLLLPTNGEKGNVVDFQAHALSALRHRLAMMDGMQEELIDVARSNMSSQARIHEACLAALDALSLEHLVHVICADWVDILGADVVSLSFEAENFDILPDLDGIYYLESGSIEALLGKAEAVMLYGGVEGDPAIFGAAADLVKAEALVGLTLPIKGTYGLLAFGARDADAFSPGQGTELLRFLGHILERSLAKWMKAAP
ncbi:MAG: DUF484 family protein [Sphingomonadales bacterium]|jgi:uncharacterized protein YigA (DUF484 family)